MGMEPELTISMGLRINIESTNIPKPLDHIQDHQSQSHKCLKPCTIETFLHSMDDPIQLAKGSLIYCG